MQPVFRVTFASVALVTLVSALPAADSVGSTGAGRLAIALAPYESALLVGGR